MSAALDTLWQEVCRAYSGEVIPHEVGKAKRELESLFEQVETQRNALRDIRDAMVGEVVDVLWSNGDFWIDELTRELGDTRPESLRSLASSSHGEDGPEGNDGRGAGRGSSPATSSGTEPVSRREVAGVSVPEASSPASESDV